MNSNPIFTPPMHRVGLIGDFGGSVMVEAESVGEEKMGCRVSWVGIRYSKVSKYITKMFKYQNQSY